MRTYVYAIILIDKWGIIKKLSMMEVVDEVSNDHNSCREIISEDLHRKSIIPLSIGTASFGALAQRNKKKATRKEASTNSCCNGWQKFVKEQVNGSKKRY